MIGCDCDRGAAVVALDAASRDKEEILYASFDLDALYTDRLSWGLFRDRRPETYKIIAER